MKSRLFWILAAALLIGLGVVIGASAIYLGLQTTPVQAAARLQTSSERSAGILVGAVEAGSPAEQAGIVRGDIILEANGTAITQPNLPADILKNLKPGDSLTLKVLHGDTTRDVTLTLGDKNGNPYLGIRPAFTVRIGRGWLEKLSPRVFGQKVDPSVTGARVIQVIAGGPAEKAGLKVGDVILKVDGQVLDAEHDLATVLGAHKVNDTVILSVKRMGQTAPLELQATLGENPDQAGKAFLGIRYHMAPKGWNVDILPKIFPDLPFPKGSGLVIHTVTAGSPAELAGLKPRDVITRVDGNPVTTPADFVKRVQGAKPGDPMTLTVNRSGEQDPLTIKVTLAANPKDNEKTYLGVTIGLTNRGFQQVVPPANSKPGVSGNNT